MKGIMFEQFGSADVMQLKEMPDPVLRPADLLVRVHAAGVNRADLTYRTGGYGWPDFGDSKISGLEIAGEVVDLGSDVSGFRVGDRIMGVVGGGAYAELARIDYRMAMHIPGVMDYVQAAAIPEAFVTAHEALIHLGRLAPGDSVLIHAAAGGVGSAVVQLAHATGAKVIATADASKLSQVKQFGAHVLIDYKHQDFAEIVARETADHGVDVLVDFVGAPYFKRNLASLADGGRLIQVGMLGGGGEVTIDIKQILLRRLQVIGTVMKSRSPAEKHAMSKRFREQWLDKFKDPRALTAVVDSTYPLARAADAHRRMESSANVGKIVLTPHPLALI